MLINDDIISIIPSEIAINYRVIPYDMSDDYVSLYTDNNSEITKNELEVIINNNIKLSLLDSNELNKLLNIYYQNTGKTEYNQDNLLQEVVEDAIKMGSTDIHFEIYRDIARIRLRIDGLLIERKKIEKELYSGIINRIKIYSKLDISEKRLPQDGRMRINEYDIRVSIIPTHFGEKVVMRILGQDAVGYKIDSIGFNDNELKIYVEAIKKSNGIVLISGPTGSGKTTTLYATLQYLNNIKRNILSVEDPVEYTIDGINQVQVNNEIGLTFSNVLRSFLRQDPDVIMLGEIRDSETAEMAIRASLTGHLVLSTLHTNSSWGTISRLIDMGIPSFLISETLNISIAQRLVRILCNNCKKETKLDLEELPKQIQRKINFDEQYVPMGCSQCNYTGYKGRKAIFELLPTNKETIEVIKNNSSGYFDFFEKNNLNTLSDKAIELLKEGTTSLSDIYSILITS